MQGAPNERNFDAVTLRWFNELAAQGIMTTDAELCIRSWNRWLEKHSHMSASQVIGRNLLEVFPDLAERGLDRYYREALSGEVRLLSNRLHKYLLRFEPTVRDGALEAMQQSAHITPLVDGGRVIGTLTVIDDVTERMAHEARLRRQLDERAALLESEQQARESAEAATRAKDAFLATVSHELRTPLNAMVGWARLLRGVEPSNPIFLKGIDTIERSVAAQTQLIEDLLDVSRIISGQMRLDVRPFELGTVVEKAVDTIRPSAQIKSIRLETKLDPRAGFVSGDPARLQQVVWNLLTNAIKFTPKGGSVEVRLSSDDSNIELTVRDTGLGMHPEFVPFVFDRFRQADGTTSRRYGGLGLGLAIVRHISELHGGTVRAESPGEGLGSTFTLTLPLASANPATVSTPPDAPADDVDLDQIPFLDGVKVLLVEDNPDSLDMLVIVLATRHAEVRTAMSARAALAVLSEWRPDVIISDIGLPGEDGIWLMRAIRALGPEQGGRIPAVAVTAFARAEDRTRSLLAGFQQHLVKPVEPAELCAVVASLVGRT
jgi:PAS domain S-box-containing protein